MPDCIANFMIFVEENHKIPSYMILILKTTILLNESF